MALLSSASSQPAALSAATAADMYGMCSVEDFPSATDLGFTHDDVQGFHDYVAQFTPPNFWFKDVNVQSWAYDKAYDNWEDEFGFDAATVVYHAGHGDMNADGVFEVLMGSEWSGQSSAYSNTMRLGDNNARYVFFSTCLSLRVLEGMTPVRTWSAANGGFRMLFGFETTSVDDADYGRFFWEEWAKNKSFGTAWLDASWRIDRFQSPSVVACGATDAEARTRVTTERQFERTRASTAFYSWRWYNQATRGAARVANLALPSRPAVAVLATPRALADLAERWDIRVRPAGPTDPALARSSDGRLVVDGSGGYEVTLGEPAEPSREVDLDAVRAAAEQAIDRHGLATETDLVFDDVVYDYIASASSSGDASEPSIRETVVNFRQVINGLPVTTPGSGEVRVRVDSAANVTAISDSTRRVTDLVERPSATVGPPDGVRTEATPEELLDRATERRTRRIAAGGQEPAFVREIPGSTEIGYHIAGQSATVVARRTVEVDCGNGMKKRYPVRVSLVE
jgi:hypothetical protein